MQKHTYIVETKKGNIQNYYTFLSEKRQDVMMVDKKMVTGLLFTTSGKERPL